MPRFRQLFVAAAAGESGHRARPARLRPAQAGRARAPRSTSPRSRPAPSSTRGCSPPDSSSRSSPTCPTARFASAIALIHSRFSTNTFPAWPLAHPYRFIAHNGEINTVQGNRNWMRARESQLATDAISGPLERIFPIVTPDGQRLRLLRRGPRAAAPRPAARCPHAVLMMIPEAWENHAEMDPAQARLLPVQRLPDGALGRPRRRHLHRRHRHRRRPRPQRPAPLPLLGHRRRPRRARLRGRRARPRPGQGRAQGPAPARPDVPRRHRASTASSRTTRSSPQLAAEQPYQDWLHAGLHPPRATARARAHRAHPRLRGAPPADLRLHRGGTAHPARPDGQDRLRADRLDGLRHPARRALPPPPAPVRLLHPAVRAGHQPAAGRHPGRAGHLPRPPPSAPRTTCSTPRPAACRQVELPFPVIDNDELAKLIHINADGDLPGLKAVTVSGLYRVAGGGTALRERLAEINAEVSAAIEDGARIIVLSDRHSDAEQAPIPSLLLTASVHHHLIREKTRTHTSLLVEAGDVREVHHVALLIGFGAAAVNPYLAMETVEDLANAGTFVTVRPEKAIRNLIKALGKGVLKVMSKMGISTVASYRGAQVFEAVGLSQDLVETSTSPASPPSSAASASTRSPTRSPPATPAAYPRGVTAPGAPPASRSAANTSGGARASRTCSTPRPSSGSSTPPAQRPLRRLQAVHRPGQRAVRAADDAARPVRLQARRARAPSRIEAGRAGQRDRQALLHRRHVLRLHLPRGARDPRHRHEPHRRQVQHRRRRRGPRAPARPRQRRSAIKQVASGRFGVTSEYLANADDLQIKMAQGAKPGEGGQLPGHKVYPWIAAHPALHPRRRPHLAAAAPRHLLHRGPRPAHPRPEERQPRAPASTSSSSPRSASAPSPPASSKAHADVVLISGHDGGTGASPLTSLKHAGVPWELGLAETQQTLLLNDLRDRIVVQTDGQLKTGRDVLIAALLGAEEFGFATAPLIVSGCVMMRVCHLDTCPVGVATQNPELRATLHRQARVRGQLLRAHRRGGARTARRARLPHHRRDRRPGRAPRRRQGRRALEGRGPRPEPDLPPARTARRRRRATAPPCQDHGLAKALDNELIDARPATPSTTAPPCASQLPVRNVNRTVGTMLGARGHQEVRRRRPARRHHRHHPHRLRRPVASAPSCPRGITLRLEGDANDYVGKGLSGGRIIVCPPREATFDAARQHHRRQRRRLRRHQRRDLPLAAPSASASACATPAPPWSSKASATTAANT